MRLPFIAGIACLLFASVGQAEEPELGPAIEGYGPTFAVADRDVPLQDGFVYRAVFDAAAYPGDVSELNQRINSVARFVNMHVRHGVSLDEMDIAVVVHGPALKSLLSDEAYRARYDANNPSRELVERLMDAGVAFYVCGQSMAFGGFEKEELLPDIDIGLSAMTMLVMLQSRGYALLN